MNVYDIAKLAGVSTATVSRVINNKNNVSEKTRSKVQKIINMNNFIPNEQARSLSNRDSKLVALMLPDISNPFFQKLINHITDECAKYGYHTVLYNTNEEISLQHRFIESVIKLRASSLIITPIFFHDDKSAVLLKWLLDNSIPVVLIDRDIENVKADGIFSNDFEGSRKCINSLVKSGVKKIATISGPLSSKPGYQRFDGYIKSLEENKIRINKDYIKHGDFMVGKAYNLTLELLFMKDPPNAIFCANNLTTIGCVKCLFENNIKPGKDILISGFDEIEAFNYAGFNITTVQRPVEKMAVEAVNLVMKRLKEKKKTYEVERIIFDTNLISRNKF